MMVNDELGQELKAHQNDAKFLREQGVYDKNDQITIKGLDILRKTYLDEKVINDYLDFNQKHMMKVKADEQEHTQKWISLSKTSRDEAVLTLARSSVLTSSATEMLAELIESVFVDLAAIAKNQIDIRKDLRELVDAFEKSDRDGKKALRELTEKLKQQDQEIGQAKQLNKWFRRYEKDKIKGVAE